jgi:hypothetical protein
VHLTTNEELNIKTDYTIINILSSICKKKIKKEAPSNVALGALGGEVMWTTLR